ERRSAATTSVPRPEELFLPQSGLAGAQNADLLRQRREADLNEVAAFDVEPPRETAFAVERRRRRPPWWAFLTSKLKVGQSHRRLVPHAARQCRCWIRGLYFEQFG